MRYRKQAQMNKLHKLASCFHGYNLLVHELTSKLDTSQTDSLISNFTTYEIYVSLIN